jgi:hypothetical protein
VDKNEVLKRARENFEWEVAETLRLARGAVLLGSDDGLALCYTGYAVATTSASWMSAPRLQDLLWLSIQLRARTSYQRICEYLGGEAGPGV